MNSSDHWKVSLDLEFRTPKLTIVKAHKRIRLSFFFLSAPDAPNVKSVCTRGRICTRKCRTVLFGTPQALLVYNSGGIDAFVHVEPFWCTKLQNVRVLSRPKKERRRRPPLQDVPGTYRQSVSSFYVSSLD